MGRELQKKKNRSSLSKVRRKPKSKKLHFNNPTIARNWDKSKTLSQNYKELGLAVGLNKPAGGTEKTIKILEDNKAKGGSNKLAITSGLPTSLSTGEARVERDPETGQILRIVDDATAQQEANPLNDPLNNIENEAGMVMQHTGNQTELVKELEAQAALGERKKPRHQSAREKEWIETLISRHGDDYERMFRDRKLNPMQQSVGQLRKRVLAWQKSNGS